MDAIRERLSSLYPHTTATTAAAGTPSAAIASLATKDDPHAYAMTDIVHGHIAYKYVPCEPNAGYSPNGHCIILTPLGCHDTRSMVKVLEAEEEVTEKRYLLKYDFLTEDYNFKNRFFGLWKMVLLVLIIL